MEAGAQAGGPDLHDIDPHRGAPAADPAGPGPGRPVKATELSLRHRAPERGVPGPPACLDLHDGVDGSAPDDQVHLDPRESDVPCDHGPPAQPEPPGRTGLSPAPEALAGTPGPAVPGSSSDRGRRGVVRGASHRSGRRRRRARPPRPVIGAGRSSSTGDTVSARSGPSRASRRHVSRGAEGRQCTSRTPARGGRRLPAAGRAPWDLLASRAHVRGRCRSPANDAVPLRGRGARRCGPGRVGGRRASAAPGCRQRRPGRRREPGPGRGRSGARRCMPFS